MINYPTYRKYSDGNTFFKIMSETELFEIKRMGKYYSKTDFQAKIYPEKMFIQDLLLITFESIQLSSENEFNEVLNTWSSELILSKI